MSEQDYIWSVAVNDWISDFEPPFETVFGSRDFVEAQNEIFEPLGYKLKERTVIPKLDYTKPLHCSQVFTKSAEGLPSMKTIPYHLYGPYSLNGYVRIVKERPGEYSQDPKTLQALRYKQRRQKEYELYQKMKEIHIKGHTILAVGLKPDSEVRLLLEQEASHELDIEVSEDIDHLPSGDYDLITFFSSLEKAGVTRLLDPFGDLTLMKKLRCFLAPDGLLIVRIPIGYDLLFWNQKRVYGRARIGLLMAGFDIVDIVRHSYSVKSSLDLFRPPTETGIGVIFVLRKR